MESITTNKASGGDGIPVELFQILKEDAVKVVHSICQQIWKTQQWPQDWKKVSFHSNPKKGNVKECSNYLTITLFSQASKVMLKIIQTGVQHYLNHALPVFKLDFEKVEEPQIKVPINFGSQKSKSVPEKHLLLLYWLATTFSCMDHNKLMKILKEMGIPDRLNCFLRNLYES